MGIWLTLNLKQYCSSAHLQCAISVILSTDVPVSGREVSVTVTQAGRLSSICWDYRT